MKQSVQLVPTHAGVGLISTTIGLVRSLEEQGFSVTIFNPIKFNDIAEIAEGLVTSFTTQITFEYAEQCILSNKLDLLLENITEQYENCLKQSDIVVIKGVLPRRNHEVAALLNQRIAKDLDCDIIIVTSPISNIPADIQELVEITAQSYGGFSNAKLKGCIINQLGGGSLVKEQEQYTHEVFPSVASNHITKKQVEKFIIFNANFKLIAAINWDINLLAPRVLDIIKVLGADIIAEGDLKNRRVKQVKIIARTVNNIISILTADTLIITAGDRVDVLLAVCYAVVSGIKIPAILLTGKLSLSDEIIDFCQPAVAAGLNIINLPLDSFQTSMVLHNIRIPPPFDDEERLEYTRNYIASHIDKIWITEFTSQEFKRKLSPPAFKFKLIELARGAQKTIVLPEGQEPRIILAASICAARNIAKCILLGDPEEIRSIAQKQGIELNLKKLILQDPELLEDNYIEPLVALRQNKGMTSILAKEQLKDNTVLATMMVQMGHADGLVSGAINSTANTIRPALQLIKTNRNSTLVSSIFFMCLPDQVLVYGDCAVNPDPTAQQLAEIAIQSSNTARAFGLDPKIAMISYSTGTSGSGVDVDKVKQATELVKSYSPDLVIDGPLQYDAALIKSVAQTKAPNSPVAGNANVIIFPDLNTGNTTYKAVQRSANILSIGPVLQGLNKPVNDLSRGATIEDIIYTVAITSIQASHT